MDRVEALFMHAKYTEMGRGVSDFDLKFARQIVAPPRCIAERLYQISGEYRAN